MIEDEESARIYVAGLCDAQAMERLEMLVTELRTENERQNLVSRGTLANVWQRHIADSAQLVRFVPRETPIWLDLGTGAGFPGLVISAIRPDCKVILVEPRKKRFEWLEHMRAILRLLNCRVDGRRIELVERFSADVISARAFAPLPRTLEVVRRFSTSNTRLLLPKGRSAEEELQVVPERWRRMFHVEQSLTDADAKILVGTRGCAA